MLWEDRYSVDATFHSNNVNKVLGWFLTAPLCVFLCLIRSLRPSQPVWWRARPSGPTCPRSTETAWWSWLPRWSLWQTSHSCSSSSLSRCPTRCGWRHGASPSPGSRPTPSPWVQRLKQHRVTARGQRSRMVCFYQLTSSHSRSKDQPQRNKHPKLSYVYYPCLSWNIISCNIIPVLQSSHLAVQ